MKPNWFRLAPVLLAAALGFAACGDQAGEPLAPQAAQFGKGGEKGSNGRGKDDVGPKVRGRKADGTSTEFVLATWDPTGVRESQVSKTIGSSGGSLATAEHFLYVPAGAVSQTTVFRMRSFRKSVGTDGATILAVDLTAVVVGKDGRETDVGGQGFAREVILGINYGRSTNIAGHEASASVLYLAPDGTVQAVSGGSTSDLGSWFSLQLGSSSYKVGKLSHFSQYGVGWPNRCDEGC